MSKITVITINHGDEATLPRALASLTLQNVDLNVVLVADGPGQCLAQITSRFPELSIRIIENASNLGRGASRQLALAEVDGDWVTFLDADDWYITNKLERQLDVVHEHPELGLVSTDIHLVSDRDRQLTVRRYQGAQGILSRREVPFAPSLIRTSIARRAGFDPSYRVGEDRPFLDEILAEVPAYVLPEPLYVYHRSPRRSLAEEFNLRRAHVRQEFAAGQGEAQFGASIMRETAAAMLSQLSQHTGHWLDRLRSSDVSATGAESSELCETATTIRASLLERGFTGDSTQLIFD